MRFVGAMFFGLSVAYPQSMVAEPASIEAGRKAAVGCVGCHEANTVDLSGREHDALVERMRAIRDGRDDRHPPVLGALNDRELLDLAAFFASPQG